MIKEILDIFHSLKEHSGMSNQQIADRANLSVSTINRFFRGEIENPSFEEVNRILIAMGYSITGLLDGETYAITRYNIDELLLPYLDRITEPYKHELEIAKKDIEHLSESLSYRRRMCNISFAVNIALVAFVCAALIIDSLNPNVGWFREMMSRYSGEMLGLIGL